MEGKDVYILLAFALLRLTGDHPAHHVDDALLGLTPEHGHFSNKSIFAHCSTRCALTRRESLACNSFEPLWKIFVALRRVPTLTPVINL